MKKVPWIVEMTTLEAFRSQPTVIFACSLLWSVSWYKVLDVTRTLGRMNTCLKGLWCKERKCEGGWIHGTSFCGLITIGKILNYKLHHVLRTLMGIWFSAQAVTIVKSCRLQHRLDTEEQEMCKEFVKTPFTRHQLGKPRWWQDKLNDVRNKHIILYRIVVLNYGTAEGREEQSYL
jgi:hypothetical protein